MNIGKMLEENLLLKQFQLHQAGVEDKHSVVPGLSVPAECVCGRRGVGGMIK